MPFAPCAIRRCCSARRGWTASSPSISQSTAANRGDPNDESRRGAPQGVRHAVERPGLSAGPYKFYNREFVVITYRTDPDRLHEVVPEPLEVAGDTVAYEFIRMPDSTGFGDYTETGQVI